MGNDAVAASFWPYPEPQPPLAVATGHYTPHTAGIAPRSAPYNHSQSAETVTGSCWVQIQIQMGGGEYNSAVIPAVTGIGNVGARLSRWNHMGSPDSPGAMPRPGGGYPAMS